MGQSKLKDVAKANPTQLGDPVSLKAETSETEPTEKDRPAAAAAAANTPSDGGHKSLKQVAQEKMQTNPTQLGDPVSLKAETSSTEPTENDRGAGKAHPQGAAKSKL